MSDIIISNENASKSKYTALTNRISTSHHKNYKQLDIKSNVTFYIIGKYWHHHICYALNNN